MAAGYAKRGIVAVAPSYRLGRNPDHVEDVAEAVRWVVRNIEQYGGDPRQIYLSGHSAGGNIVSLLACSHHLDDMRNEGDDRGVIKGVVAISGVYSLHSPMGRPCAITAPLAGAMNAIYYRMYVKPVFGDNKEVAVANSPTCLIQVVLFKPCSRLKPLHIPIHAGFHASPFQRVASSL